MQATFVFHNTNAPFEMCATRMITAKQMQEMQTEEMRGKCFLGHFKFLPLHLIFQPQYLQDSQILFFLYYALHQSTKLLKFNYIEYIFQL